MEEKKKTTKPRISKSVKTTKVDAVSEEELKKEIEQKLREQIALEEKQKKEEFEKNNQTYKTPLKNLYNMGFWFGLFFGFVSILYFLLATKEGSYERETAAKGWLKGFWWNIGITIALTLVFVVTYLTSPIVLY